LRSAWPRACSPTKACTRTVDTPCSPHFLSSRWLAPSHPRRKPRRRALRSCGAKARSSPATTTIPATRTSRNRSSPSTRRTSRRCPSTSHALACRASLHRHRGPPRHPRALLRGLVAAPLPAVALHQSHHPQRHGLRSRYRAAAKRVRPAQARRLRRAPATECWHRQTAVLVTARPWGSR
jgi:hypothetical protein